MTYCSQETVKSNSREPSNRKKEVQNWYYLDASGAMVTDTVVEGYRIGRDGVWVK